MKSFTQPSSIEALFADASEGIHPAANGQTELLPAPLGARACVIAFTNHAIVGADVSIDWLEDHLDPTDIGASLSLTFLAALAAHTGAKAETQTIVLCAPSVDATPTGQANRLSLSDLRPVAQATHPRHLRALTFRTDVRAYETKDGTGLIVLGRGLAGRWEMAVEVDPAHQGRGLGRSLCQLAPCLIPDGQPLFAQVAPGNAASLNMILKSGYRPVGSEVLFV